MTRSGTPTTTSSLTPSQTATPTGTPSQTPSRYADLDSVSSAAAGSVVAPAVGGAVAALAVLGACAAVALLRERRKRFVAKARSRDATAAAVEKAVALAMRDNPLSASKSRLLTSSQRQVALAESGDPVARAMAAALSGGDAAARARAERLAAERAAAIAALAVIDVEAERLERDANYKSRVKGAAAAKLAGTLDDATLARESAAAAPSSRTLVMQSAQVRAAAAPRAPRTMDEHELASQALPPLPEGWVQTADAEGRQYFANPNTGESQWERPSA